MSNLFELDKLSIQFLVLRYFVCRMLVYLYFEVRRKSFSVRPEITFQKELWVRARNNER